MVWGIRHQTTSWRDHANVEYCADDTGFTLLELLVALTILSFSLVTLLGVFSHSVARDQLSREQMTAQSIAENLLADAPANLSLGERSGSFPPHYRWSMRIQDYGGTDDRKSWPAVPVQVTATVRWPGAAGERQVQLTTLRLLAKSRSP